ncbi:MAG TPA: endospore germination permease [Firmicutes bacterium]|nr:endospore germination permease [Bacillota bacterium]
MSTRAGRPAIIDAAQVGLAIALLVAGTAFLSLPRITASPAGSGAWVGVVGGAALALPLLWLLLALYLRHPGLTLVGTGRRLCGPFLGSLLGLALVAWSHFYLAVLVREFTGVFLVTFMPETPLSVFVAVTVALLMYAAYQGMEAIVRTAQVFLPFIVVSLLVIVLGVLPRFKAGHLLPLSGNGWPGVGLAALYTASPFAQALAATAFFPLLRQPREARPALAVGLVAAAVTFLLLTTAELGAFSAPVLDHLAFPTLSAARLIRLGLFFERFEAGFMVVWFVLSFLKLALFFFFATATLAEVLGLATHKPLCLPGGLIVAFTAFFPENDGVTRHLLGLLYRYGLVAFAVPLFLLAVSWLAGRGSPTARKEGRR